MKISRCCSVARVPQTLEIFTSNGTGECSEANSYLPTPVVKMLSQKTAQHCRWAGAGAPAHSSENDLAAHLQYSVEVCLIRLDRPEGTRAVEIVARLAKDRMVGEVKGFRTEFEMHLFYWNGERANDRSIEIDPSLILQSVAAPIPVGVLGRNRPGCGIEPFRFRLIRKIWVTHLVGAFVASVSDVGDIRAVDHGEILTVAPSEDTVDLPIAKDIVTNAVAGRKALAFSDRELIETVGSEH